MSRLGWVNHFVSRKPCSNTSYLTPLETSVRVIYNMRFWHYSGGWYWPPSKPATAARLVPFAPEYRNYAELCSRRT